MQTFDYRAIGQDGSVMTGTLTAENRPEAVSRLKEQGAKPLKVELNGTHGGEKTAEASEGPKRGRVSHRDIMVFTSQVAALLKAGIVMSQALSILEEQSESEGLSQIIHQVRHDVIGGESLSDALQKHPKHFSKLYCSMVRVGETGGVLEAVLKQLADFMEAEAALRSNIMTALAYPMLVVMVGIGSIGLLVTVVIPRLSSVFAGFGDSLPWITQFLIMVSDVVLGYWWLLLIMFAGLVYGARWLYQNPEWRERIERVQEKMPGLGPVIVKSQVARFTRMLGTLVKSGIPVMQALNLVVETTGSAHLSNILRQVSEKVKKGEGLSKPLKESGFFPPMVINLIAVGEESGSLDEMLFQVADTYDEEVQHSIKRFITLFEPIVIVLMAIGVGVVLFAFLLPILNISNTVG